MRVILGVKVEENIHIWECGSAICWAFSLDTAPPRRKSLFVLCIPTLLSSSDASCWSYSSY